jgi:hypothetical protein
MSDEMMPDSENDIVRVTNALDPDPGKASGLVFPKRECLMSRYSLMMSER